MRGRTVLPVAGALLTVCLLSLPLLAQGPVSETPIGPDLPPDVIDDFPFPFPGEVIPRLDPREEKLLKCLQAARGTMEIEPYVYGARLRIALPHAGLSCRLRRQAEMLREAAPDALGAPLAVGDSPATGSFEAVRGAHGRWMQAAEVHFDHLQVLEGQRQRFDSMAAARTELLAAFDLLSQAPPQDFEALTLVYRIGETPECLDEGREPIADDGAVALGTEGETLSAEEEAARAEPLQGQAAIYDALSFLPLLDGVLRAVNLSAGVVVPQQVDTCERGPVQAACAASRPIAWSDDCWQPDAAEEPVDWPCADEQPLVWRAYGFGTGCPGDLEALHPPFFTAPSRAGRSGVLPPDDAPSIRLRPPAEWSDLADALNALPPAAEVARPRFQRLRDDDLAAFRPEFHKLASHLDVEGAALDRERARLDAEGGELRRLEEEMAAARSDIEAKKAHEERLAARLAELEQRIVELDARSGDAEAGLEKLEEERRRLAAAADAVTLACGGRSYDECRDERAKEDYDQRFFDALEVLARADGEFFRQLQLVVGLRNESLESTLERVRRQIELVETTRGRVAIERRLGDVLADYSERKPVYDAHEARYGRVRPGFDRDQELRRVIDAYLASTEGGTSGEHGHR